MEVTVAAAVSKAFSCLSDGNHRAHYDRYGEDEDAVGRRPSQGGGAYGPADFDPDEIFNMFFGGGAFGGRRVHCILLLCQPCCQSCVVGLPRRHFLLVPARGCSAISRAVQSTASSVSLTFGPESDVCCQCWSGSLSLLLLKNLLRLAVRHSC